jgi:hypothetical protein
MRHAATFLLVALLCSAISGAARRPRGATPPLKVTVGTENPKKPVAGSLGQIINSVTQPGDTIQFQSGVVAQMADDLEIPSRLTGLRIEGPGGISRSGAGCSGSRLPASTCPGCRSPALPS